jgi:ADP-ribose pyrophosphatase YjhB (NUDIX family)
MHIYFRFARPMTLGVRAIVADSENRILLVRHTYISGWHLPGGGVEAGESMLEALAREVEEEGAVRMRAPAILHGMFFNRSASPRDHVAVYLVRDFEVLGVRAPDHEIAEAGFFPRHAMPDGVTRATLARLAEALDGAPTDAFW